MGSGIAQVGATAGLGVVLVDVDGAALERGLRRLDRGLERAVERGRLSDDAARAARERVETSVDLEASGATADHVIETVVEDPAVKREVLARLDRACRPE